MNFVLGFIFLYCLIYLVALAGGGFSIDHDRWSK